MVEQKNNLDYLFGLPSGHVMVFPDASARVCVPKEWQHPIPRVGLPTYDQLKYRLASGTT
jgi:hypothetical protein